MVSMARVLSQLLGEGEPMFSASLQRLEKATGNFGVDVQLLSDIYANSHAALRALGLDNSDTVGPELYHALLNLAAKHDEFLAKRLGAKDTKDVADVLKCVQKAVSEIDGDKTVWVVKASVMKRLLKANPPKATQKALGYRSLDSMIKREPVGSIMAAARVIEKDKWHRDFIAAYAILKPVDFEDRQVEVFYADSPKWKRLAESHVRNKRHNVTHLKELGVVAILPFPVEKLQGIAITVLPIVLYYVNEIRAYNSYIKLMQVKPEFGTIVSDVIQSDIRDHVKVLGKPIHWRIIHRYFSNTPEAIPDLFDPHVTAEDMIWRKAEDVLYRLEPALHFWLNLDYVGVLFNGHPVSMSLGDVAVCLVNKLPYEKRTIHAMRRSLWNEIHSRYTARHSIQFQIIRHLEEPEASPSLMHFSPA